MAYRFMWSEHSFFVNVSKKCIFNSENEKVLGVYIDNKLNFEYPIGKLYLRSTWVGGHFDNKLPEVLMNWPTTHILRT